MKRTIAFLILVFALIATPTLGKTIPDIKDSAVTIPWDDFKKILEELQKVDPVDDPQPPVEYTLGRGSLSGTLDNGQLEITATYPLSVLIKDWVLCPLVSTSTPLADILLDGKNAPVTDSGGNVSVVLKGPSTHTLTMRFSVTAPMRPGPGSVSLSLPQGAGQVLTLKTGSKLSGISVDGATMSRASKGGPVVAILTGDHLNLRYTVASEKKEKATKKLPAKVLVENSTLVSIDEGFIRAVVQLEYEVRHAPVSNFSVMIPESFEVADCTGASLIGWKVDETSRVLKADVGFEVQGAYNLTIVLERSTKQESFTFALPGVKVQDVERERGFFAVQVTGGVEVTVDENFKGLQPVDAKELPSGLRGGATNPIVLSFKYLRHPFSAGLKVIRHKTQPVLAAAIDSANYVIQVTEDGDCVTRAEYTVRNNRKQFMQITLPDSDKVALYSSFVANKPVRPSKTKEGNIMLPLEKSSYQGSELQSFTVEVIYYSNLGSDLDALGRIKMLLPRVDLPISRSMLTVYAPKRYRYKRLSGSMRPPFSKPPRMLPVTGFMGGKDDDKFLGDISEGEYKEAPSPPKAAKKAVSRKVDALFERQSKAEAVFQQRIRAAQNVQDQTGALPARFALPQEGTRMRFMELITIQEASTLSLIYLSSRLLSVFSFLAFLITAAMGWFARKLLLPENKKFFIIGSIAIVVLIAAGGAVEYVVFGAVLGLGARFIRWVALEILKQTIKPGQTA